ncbi:unnamed protein product, partial [Urochloa humidicola]
MQTNFTKRPSSPWQRPRQRLVRLLHRRVVRCEPTTLARVVPPAAEGRWLHGSRARACSPSPALSPAPDLFLPRCLLRLLSLSPLADKAPAKLRRASPLRTAALPNCHRRRCPTPSRRRRRRRPPPKPAAAAAPPPSSSGLRSQDLRLPAGRSSAWARRSSSMCAGRWRMSRLEGFGFVRRGDWEKLEQAGGVGRGKKQGNGEGEKKRKKEKGERRLAALSFSGCSISLRRRQRGRSGGSNLRRSARCNLPRRPSVPPAWPLHLHRGREREGASACRGRRRQRWKTKRRIENKETSAVEKGLGKNK